MRVRSKSNLRIAKANRPRSMWGRKNKFVCRRIHFLNNRNLDFDLDPRRVRTRSKMQPAYSNRGQEQGLTHCIYNRNLDFDLERKRVRTRSKMQPTYSERGQEQLRTESENIWVLSLLREIWISTSTAVFEKFQWAVVLRTSARVRFGTKLFSQDRVKEAQKKSEANFDPVWFRLDRIVASDFFCHLADAYL